MFEDFFSELCDEGFTFTETQKTIMRQVFLEYLNEAQDNAWADGHDEGYNEGYHVGREEND